MIHLAYYLILPLAVSFLIYCGLTPSMSLKDMHPLFKLWFGGGVVFIGVALMWEEYRQQKFWERMFGDGEDE